MTVVSVNRIWGSLPNRWTHSHTKKNKSKRVTLEDVDSLNGKHQGGSEVTQWTEHKKKKKTVVSLPNLTFPTCGNRKSGFRVGILFNTPPPAYPGGGGGGPEKACTRCNIIYFVSCCDCNQKPFFGYCDRNVKFFFVFVFFFLKMGDDVSTSGRVGNEWNWRTRREYDS